jgi:hypothetical protein
LGAVHVEEISTSIGFSIDNGFVPATRREVLKAILKSPFRNPHSAIACPFGKNWLPIESNELVVHRPE